MPRINFYIDVTEEEMSNFLARMSGADGRKVTTQADAPSDDEDAPAADAPATDKNGVAWDARYHASSKALNADGTWRARKNMSDEDKAAADAYNKGAATVTEQPASRSEMVNEVGQVPEPVAPTLPVAAPAPAMPGMPGLPAAAPQPVSYEEVVAAYTAAIGKNPSLDVAGLYAKAGVTDPNTLTTDAGAAQRIELKKLFEAA